MTVGQQWLIDGKVTFDHRHHPGWDREFQVDLVLDLGGGNHELVPRVIYRKGTPKMSPPIEAAQIFEA